MVDFARLTTTELVQLLNSTALGPVTSEKTVRVHREKGGLLFGDGKRTDLSRYVGWLHRQVHAPIRSTSSEYDSQRTRAQERARLKSLAARDIGEIPERQHAEERERAENDLPFFCKFFLPNWFTKPFCEQHLEILKELAHVAEVGGLQAMALPRGRGKTAMTKAAILWTILTARRRYVVWIAAQEDMAEKGILTFWNQLRTNSRIVAAWPEVCYPLVQAGPDQRRRPLYKGKELTMGRRGLQIILPDIPGSPCASSLIEASGLFGAVRGLQFDQPDGALLRPDYVVLDDPQTDESAKSALQSEDRERVVAQSVLGLAGPGVKIAAVMPCTVIRDGDLSSRILNRDLNPEWHGIIHPMLDGLPERMDLWTKYNALRVKSLDLHHDITLATEFYRQHQADMDRGSRATWPDDFNHDEISGIQHAMNLYFRDFAAFMAECQNAPLRALDEAEQLSRDGIIERIEEDLPRLIIPDAQPILTAFVDVHKDILYWMVCSWSMTFNGHIVAYGTWPDQGENFFTQRECKRKLGGLYKNFAVQMAIEKGLHDLFQEVLAPEFLREDDTPATFNWAGIDANWNISTSTVYQFAARSPWRGRIYPTHGRGIGPAEKPIHEWQRKEGDTPGVNLMIPKRRPDKPCRHIVFDTNAWKSQAAELLLAPIGGQSSVSLHQPADMRDHRLLADHFCAEKREPTQGRGRTVDIWKLPPNKPDNHWWDCYVGCTMLASLCGVAIPLVAPPPLVKKKKRRRVHALEF